MPPIRRRNHAPVSTSRRAVYGGNSTLPRHSDRLSGMPSAGPPLPQALVIDNAAPSGFTGLPREIRNEIYKNLWSGTKTLFSIKGIEMHAVYDGEDHSAMPLSGLPSWLLTNKTMLQEGIEELEFRGELVMQTPEPSDTLNNYVISNKPCMLIDLLKFRTLVLRLSPMHPALDQFLQLYLKIKDTDNYAVKRIARYLRRAKPNIFQELRIELSDATWLQEYSFDASVIEGLGGTMPRLEKVVVSIDDQNVELGGEPHPWFSLFEDVVETLLEVDEPKTETVAFWSESKKCTTYRMVATKDDEDRD
ncbi:hypothetical protein K505DRAFT_365426 [Melanomma pulvis-pyrius CBS 109.77]|uniref:Uncharacterized protein n=1 Tax=Melanomma pulvis-pyrius CBS 109.77 TaxID=1314802 RepID=A0A6A6X0D1_9PLEO|nr:hypothetical protein K505DRAFT_365426 [Melanomma pulvis-pyrius CBS 109.77]